MTAETFKIEINYDEEVIEKEAVGVELIEFLKEFPLEVSQIIPFDKQTNRRELYLLKVLLEQYLKTLELQMISSTRFSTSTVYYVEQLVDKYVNLIKEIDENESF